MNEDAFEIFDHLPIRTNIPESDYINHLWSAFSTLSDGDELAQPFAIMPFHLLFMVALQYKVLRIAQVHKEALKLLFTCIAGRYISQLSEKYSVFDVALINERTIPSIFQIIGLENSIIKEMKTLIDERNDKLAHAKGGIENNFDEKISRYLLVLNLIKKSFNKINEKLSINWVNELRGDNQVGEFIEIHLLDSYVTPSDFSQVISYMLSRSILNRKQRREIGVKCYELLGDDTFVEK